MNENTESAAFNRHKLIESSTKLSRAASSGIMSVGKIKANVASSQQSPGCNRNDCTITFLPAFNP